MRLLGRIRDLLATPSTQEAAQHAATEPDPADPSQPSRRRRGKRGGRGRRPGADAQQNQRTNETTTPTETTTRRPNNTRATPQPQTDRGQSEDRRRSDRRADDRSRGERRPRGRDYDPRRRANLDTPLPEDVAFRPAAEGGDGTILPGRRRPPPGPRTTRRVWVTGKRNLPLRGDNGDNGDGDEAAHHDHDDEPRREPAADLAPERIEGRPDDRGPDTSIADDSDDADAPKRRRRGRRGGRRRGRSNSAPNGTGAAQTDPDLEASEEPQAPRAEIAPAAAEARAAREPEAAAASPRARREPRPATQREIDPSDYPEAFRALGISAQSLAAIAAMQFTEPTPVQERSIPLLLEGRDVVGIAQTGTGKTLAFGIPMEERLDPSRPEVQALVLVPTRELAQQVLDVLTDLGKPFGLRTVGLLGGHALQGDFRALDAHPHVVVGTPGRIKDHLRRRTLSLSAVRFAVLDEADQMLDIGFLPDITHILGRTPRARQTALFSATMPHNVMQLVRRYMNQPETVAVAAELATVESVDHVYFEVAERDKVRALRELIDRELRGRTLVFSRTKRGVDRIADRLQGLGVRVGALHGDMDQRRRDRVVQDFRAGELEILIATNVAARGLDIPEITHVVNYDAADNAEEYVHRTGRTGRAGREGKAISFVSEYDIGRFDVLRETFGDRLTLDRLELYA